MGLAPLYEAFRVALEALAAAEDDGHRHDDEPEEGWERIHRGVDGEDLTA